MLEYGRLVRFLRCMGVSVNILEDTLEDLRVMASTAVQLRKEGM